MGVDAVFSADSAYLVTASSDQTARLWDVSQARALRAAGGGRRGVPPDPHPPPPPPSPRPTPSPPPDRRQPLSQPSPPRLRGFPHFPFLAHRARPSGTTRAYKAVTCVALHDRPPFG